MNKKTGFALFNQDMDIRLEPIEDGGFFNKLKSVFRKTLFESQAFMLKESREQSVGIYADREGAGTSLYERDGFWFINVGFDAMGGAQMEEMISFLEPLEPVLKNVKGDLFTNLLYELKNQGLTKKNDDSFLKELVLAFPPSLADDEKRRIFKFRYQQENIVYTFTSLHEGIVSIKEGVALIQKERLGTERLFLSSIHAWLSSIKNPEPIIDSNVLKIDIPRIVPKTNSSH